MLSRRVSFLSVSLGVLLIAGCAARRVSNVDPQARAAIGFAATAHYPGNATSATTAVLTAAVDHPDGKRIVILNLSDNAVTNPTLWVNGAYVRQLDTIPPRGTVNVNYSGLLQAGDPANDFARAQQPVVKVEVQTNNTLYVVLGPAVQH